MLHFLCAPAHSGKTAALYRLTKHLVGQGRRVLYFVPEQQTAATEAELLRLCSNRAGEALEVLNFQRLPNRVFREIGGLAVPDLTSSAHALLLCRVLRAQQAQLSLFSKYVSNPDFISELQRFFAELARSDTDAQTLLALSEHEALAQEKTLRRKLAETAHLYSAYRAVCEEVYGESEDAQTRLARALADPENAELFRGATVIFDGFYDFTAPQYELICRMTQFSEQVYLSVLEDERDPELFSRPVLARTILSSRLPADRWDCIRPSDLALPERETPPCEEFVYLCEHVLRAPEALREGTPEHIRVCACQTPYEEVCYALREIARLNETAGVRYDECAVLYRDASIYAPLLRAQSTAYAIPLYADDKVCLSDTATARFFLSAAAIATSDTRAEPFLTLLQTALCPLSEEVCLLWERYIRTWSLRGSSLYREAPYTASIFGFSEIIRDSMAEENLHTLALLNEAKAPILRAVSKLRRTMSKAESFRERVEALLDFAEQLGICDKIAQSIDEARQRGDFSLAATREGLFHEALAALEGLASLPENCDGREFCELLRLAFSFAKVGALPSSPDALSVGDVSFTRLGKVRYLFLLGLNTDVFPAKGSSLPLLSARERTLLCTLVADDPLFFASNQKNSAMEEYFLFYLACAAPTDFLHLSYACRTLGGVQSTPSVLLGRVQYLFPALETEHVCLATRLPTTLGELHRYLTLAREEDTPFVRAARALYTERTGRAAPQSEKAAQAAREKCSPLPDGTSMTISQSKLETYTYCPYQYFLKYVLHLSEEPTATPDHSLTGVIVHSALEHLCYPLSQGRRLAPELLCRETVEREFEAQRASLLDAGYKLRPEDEFWLADLRASTHLLADSMREEFSLGAFRPVLFEADLQRDLKTLVLPLSRDCRLRLSGKADRIDAFRDPADGTTYVRVVDYKKSEHSIKLKKLYNGFSMQLLLYLITLAEQGIKLDGRFVAAVPAGAYYLHSYATAESLSDTDRKKLLADAEYAPQVFARNGIFIRHDAALEAMLPLSAGKKEKSVPIRRDKNDEYAVTSGSLLTTEEEFDVLKRAVLDYTAKTGERILSGHFPCRPLWEENEKSACKYCPYRSICREDSPRPTRSMKDAPAAEDFFEDIKAGGIGCDETL